MALSFLVDTSVLKRLSRSEVREGVAVLHYDADFHVIAAITGQRCQWVVPAGTVE